MPLTIGTNSGALWASAAITSHQRGAEIAMAREKQMVEAAAVVRVVVEVVVGLVVEVVVLVVEVVVLVELVVLVVQLVVKLSK